MFVSAPEGLSSMLPQKLVVKIYQDIKFDAWQIQ